MKIDEQNPDDIIANLHETNERLRYALTQIDKMTDFPERYGPDAIGQVARQALTSHE